MWKRIKAYQPQLPKECQTLYKYQDEDPQKSIKSSPCAHWSFKTNYLRIWRPYIDISYPLDQPFLEIENLKSQMTKWSFVLSLSRVWINREVQMLSQTFVIEESQMFKLPWICTHTREKARSFCISSYDSPGSIFHRIFTTRPSFPSPSCCPHPCLVNYFKLPTFCSLTHFTFLISS